MSFESCIATDSRRLNWIMAGSEGLDTITTSLPSPPGQAEAAMQGPMWAGV